MLPCSFASHKFGTEPATTQPKVSFIGTNDGKALLYVFREKITEMREHDHHRALDRFKPARPVRQSCVVALGGTDALNLSGEFLADIICLDFDDLRPSKILRELISFRERTTTFCGREGIVILY
jgi:hypothetical protein